MSGGSMRIHSESLEKQLQNGVLPIQVPSATRTIKPPKTFKENETLIHWICKFAGRKKVGMLLFFAISTTVFVWVLYIGKDEDRINYNVPKVNHRLPLNNSGSPQNLTSLPVGAEGSNVNVMPPPSPSYFLGYSLPPGHRCNSFSLPPPPADKKRTGPRPCPVCYLPVEEAVALMPKLPSFSPVVKNLTYIYEEKPNKDTEFGGSDFGGYPTLKQRNDSFDVRESMNVHCGFVNGSRPGHGTGFDIDDNDLLEMEQCHGVVVASAIFGAFDIINQPIRISQYSEQTVCFYMFVDQHTKDGLYGGKKIGLWRIVVVHNLPYVEARRNGKIPKLLTHRLFPNARYSLWIDGKLQLLVDPYQILERFLWRKNATFAISRHYRRFDVFVEVEANKAAQKYDNASLDFQVEFYKNEGLTPYSEAKLPITSDVPEGCVIIREHVPISNLFTCLWFNEVDRFTPRDQISFSTVRDRIAAHTNWTVNMFWDCERRNFVFQHYHKDILDRRAQMAPPAISPPPPPQSLTNDPPRMLFSLESSDVSPRHGRRRGSSSRHHLKVGNEIVSS